MVGVSGLLPEAYGSGWIMFIQSSIRAGIQIEFIKVGVYIINTN